MPSSFTFSSHRIATKSSPERLWRETFAPAGMACGGFDAVPSPRRGAFGTFGIFRGLFGPEHRDGPIRGIARSVGAGDRDGIDPPGAVLGPFRAQINREITGDDPVWFLVAITESIDRLVAGDRCDPAGARTGVVGGLDANRHEHHLMIRRAQGGRFGAETGDDRALGVTDGDDKRTRGLVARRVRRRAIHRRGA